MNGLIAWAILIVLFCTPAFIKWLRGLDGASPSTEEPPVSRNRTEKWEQDYPWPECFEEMSEEDDL